MAQKRGSRKAAAGSSRSGDAADAKGEQLASPKVRTALIRGNSFAAKAVQYVEVDGLAIFEGDIVLGTVEEVESATEMLRAEMTQGVESGVAITGAQFRWPNCRVPFRIDAALPNQNRVTDAIAHWHANTNYRFVARTTEADFVTFRVGTGCSSSVGRRTGEQFVNLAAGCGTGSTIHEIGHVIGLWHEQSREDRDLFVTINFANIIPGMEHNFNQHITDGDDIGAYDFGSIMHYPRDAFTVNGSDTITPLAALPPGVVMGQRTGLSAGDIAAANSVCTPATLKEGPKDPIKEARKEILKEIPRDTRKELIKDIRFDTRKEIVLDTRKELIRDTIKEGAFDPGPTLAENVITPGRQPVVQPGLITPVVGGARPFAVTTPHFAGGGGSDATTNDLQGSIAQLDAQLADLAEQLAMADANQQSLQAQYNETSALLAQLVEEHDASAG
ncbi:MAG: M12 family metallopeptidase [Gemmatimonadales bacterium]